MSEVTSSPAVTTDRTLKRDTLKLRHAIVISVAVMSPASIFFNTIPQASVVGAAIPLCFVIAFVITLFVANQYSEFSREIPSSGSSYTFVTAGLGPHLGYLTAWCGLIAVALGIAFLTFIAFLNVVKQGHLLNESNLLYLSLIFYGGADTP